MPTITSNALPRTEPLPPSARGPATEQQPRASVPPAGLISPRPTSHTQSAAPDSAEGGPVPMDSAPHGAGCPGGGAASSAAPTSAAAQSPDANGAPESSIRGQSLQQDRQEGQQREQEARRQGRQQVILSDFLDAGPLPEGRRLYVVALNYTLPAGLLHVWRLASYRVCADGGVNRLHDELLGMAPPPPPRAAPETSADTSAALEAGLGPGQATHADSNGNGVAAACRGAVQPQSGKQQQHDNRQQCHEQCHNGNGRGAAPHDSTAGNGAAAPPTNHNPPTSNHQPLTDAGSGDGCGPAAAAAAALRVAYLPDVVLGDLDSLRPDVRRFYTSYGVPFVDLSYDQDTTDLTKAVQLIEERFIRADPDADSDPDRHQIVVLGALGGRLDHTLANLNTLHMFPHLAITLWGEGNLVRLLRPGRAAIRPHTGFEGPTCGLIPIAGPVTATSSGLKWNLAATPMRVGGLVSSSNSLDPDAGEVTVDTDGPLLWSTELHTEPLPDPGELWAWVAGQAAAAAERRRAGEAGKGAEVEAVVVA